MPMSTFHVSHQNPNDNTGGGGCICSPDKVTDCKGPYVIVPGNDMDSPLSPHVVVGEACVHRMVKVLAEAAGEEKAQERSAPKRKRTAKAKPADEVPEV